MATDPTKTKVPVFLDPVLLIEDAIFCSPIFQALIVVSLPVALLMLATLSMLVLLFHLDQQTKGPWLGPFSLLELMLVSYLPLLELMLLQVATWLLRFTWISKQKGRGSGRFSGENSTNGYMTATYSSTTGYCYQG